MSTRTLVVQNLSASDLAAVKAFVKAHPKNEALALRDLLRLGLAACVHDDTVDVADVETLDLDPEETV